MKTRKSCYKCESGWCQEHQLQHTPTPWNTDGESIFYCPPKNHDSIDSDLHIAKVYVPEDSEGPQKEGLANAAFIVRAVNEYQSLKDSHEELLEALRYISDDAETSFESVSDMTSAGRCARAIFERIGKVATQAIAKAEGK